MQFLARIYLASLLGLGLVLIFASPSVFAIDGNAMKPPMGWNSFDCIGHLVVGSDIKKAADNMAAELKKYGYEYIVVDQGWEGSASSVDAYGRFVPAGKGFDTEEAGSLKGMADYCHNLGLKFGIWGIRGVPRAAYNQSLPILGTNYTAQDIGDMINICPWNNFNYGINWVHPGAQAYINSVVDLYASWGIDFIKIDDLVTNPKPPSTEVYHKEDISAYRTAIRKTGRPMVYSLSPGRLMTVDLATHASQFVDMYRTSADLWDYWNDSKKSIDICRMFQKASDYSQLIGPGQWADLDMLPIGTLRTGPSKLTDTEQQTAMSLWCIFRSPLILGHDIRNLTPQIMRIIANEEVIAVNQNSTNSQKIFDQDSLIIWTSDIPGSGTPISKNVAFFNLRGQAATLDLAFSNLGFSGACQVRDLWAKADLPDIATQLSASIPSHGSGLYKISPASLSPIGITKPSARSSAVLKTSLSKTQLTISYYVPISSPVIIDLYTLRGVRVKPIINETKNAGHYTEVVTFDAEKSKALVRTLLVAKIGSRTFTKKIVMEK